MAKSKQRSKPQSKPKDKPLQFGDVLVVGAKVLYAIFHRDNEKALSEVEMHAMADGVVLTIAAIHQTMHGGDVPDEADIEAVKMVLGQMVEEMRG